MAPAMFVTALTGRASILRRPPDISSTNVFQSRKSSWKMSLPAQPDWTFHVIVSAREMIVGAADVPAPVPAAVGEADGALAERHDVTNAARPDSDPYLRNPRRESLERRPTMLSTS